MNWWEVFGEASCLVGIVVGVWALTHWWEKIERRWSEAADHRRDARSVDVHRTALRALPRPQKGRKP